MVWKDGPAPLLHGGGSPLTSGAGLWITAMVKVVLDQHTTINPREIMVEQTVVNECWETSGL